MSITDSNALELAKFIDDIDRFIEWQRRLEKESTFACPHCYANAIVISKNELTTRFECNECHHQFQHDTT